MIPINNRASNIRAKCFWDDPDKAANQFDKWISENANVQIIGISSGTGVIQEEGYGYSRTSILVVYQITEEHLRAEREKEEAFRLRYAQSVES